MLKLFYLNDGTLQHHFRRLITLYLAYNRKFGFLNEAEVSVALVDCARMQKGEKVCDYLWLAAQVPCYGRTVGKTLKIAHECINSESF